MQKLHVRLQIYPNFSIYICSCIRIKLCNHYTLWF